MERRQQGADGKIQGLIELHAEHPEGFEATLVQAGLRWRDVESSSPRRRAHAWQDIDVIISTRSWDSPLSRMEPDWWWGDPKHDLLATLIEVTGATNVKTPAPKGVKKSDFPKITRPWEQSKNNKRIGSDPLPLADLDSWLDGDFAPLGTDTHGGQKEMAVA